MAKVSTNKSNKKAISKAAPTMRMAAKLLRQMPVPAPHQVATLNQAMLTPPPSNTAPDADNADITSPNVVKPKKLAGGKMAGSKGKKVASTVVSS